VFNNTSTITNLDFYLWKFGDGNQSTTSGNATHSYSTASNYIVTLIAATQNGCRDTASHTITVKSNPTAAFTSAPVCIGTLALFTDGSTSAAGDPISLWNWNFADGSPNAQIQNPSHIYITPGNYSVTLIVKSQFGCKDSMTQTTNVNPLPVVTITTNGSTVLHAGSSVQLIANGASSYLWSTNATSSYITVDSIGTYFVTGTDLNNCKAKDSITVTIENSDTVSVTGNLLTPNGDGINDELKIFNVSAYANCELNIYNMWNDKVYSVKEYKNDWKGTNSSGADLPAGPYYYIIKCDDKPLLKGNINILR
jgi:gliding motility-associated-like protein